MGNIAPVPPVKLFVVTLHSDDQILKEAAKLLQQKFGETDLVSKDFPFNATRYYEKEMGRNLFRRFYAFERVIAPDQILESKLLTNEFESRFRNETGRTINLDPGYIDYYKLVLASTKFGGQKIYLGKAIYADMTLIMNKGKWQPFDWSFPDFRSGVYDRVLLQIRDLYKAQVPPPQALLKRADSK